MRIILGFIFLYVYVACVEAFAVSEHKIWEEATKAIQSQNQEQIRKLNDELIGKTAPEEFVSSQPKKETYEAEVYLQNRMFLPRLFCSIGWESTLFLTVSAANFEEFFGNMPSVPSALYGKETRDLLMQRFIDLKTATRNGELGAALFILIPNTCKQ